MSEDIVYNKWEQRIIAGVIFIIAAIPLTWILLSLSKIDIILILLVLIGSELIRRNV